MTPDELAAIKARAEAATEGPWDHFRSAYLGNLVHRIGSVDDNADVALVPCSFGREEDAEFIAHARVDIPDLLAVIDKVRAIHLPMPIRSKLWCLECESHHPCPTVRALGGDS